MKTLTRISLSSLLVVVAAHAAHAGTFDVALHCWSGTNQSGPFLAALPFDEVAKQFTCKVLVSNNTGTSVTGAHFALSFGQAPTARLVQNPALADQDPGAHFDCPAAPPSGTTFRPSMVLNVRTAFDGFPAGTAHSGDAGPYGKRCADFATPPSASWDIDVGAASTAEMRVDFVSGFLVVGSTFTTALQLDVTNLPGGVTVAPVTLPVNVAIPQHDLEAEVLQAPFQSPAMAMAGTVYAGTSWFARRGTHTGMVVDFYLPYVRFDGSAWVVHVDGGYDAGSDKLVFDEADLQLNSAYSEFIDLHASRWRDHLGGVDETRVGDLPLPFERVAADHYHIDFGVESGNAGDLGTRRIMVAWAANYSADPDVQGALAPIVAARGTGISGRVCAYSDQAPSPACATVQPLLFTASEAVAKLYGQFEYSGFNQTAQFEGSSATPFTELWTFLAPPLAPWRNAHLTTVSQVPIDAAGHKGDVTFLHQSGIVFVARDHYGAYSLAPTDGGHETNLVDRVVPSSSVSDWVDVGPVMHFPPTALPVATTEVKSECAPSRYAVENFNVVRECDPGIVWKVPRDARSSIDGSSYNPTDMTRASLGSVAHITMTDGASVRMDGKLSYNIEVQGGSRYSLDLVNDSARPQDYLAQSWAANQNKVTTNTYASVGCVFGNLGLDNVRGPLTLTVDWPIGWAPTSTTADLEDAVHSEYGNDTLRGPGENWGAANGTPIPAAHYDIELDAVARRIVMTFDGPLASGMFPGADQVAPPLDYTDARWVGFRMDGQYLPGVAHFPKWTCTATLAESVTAAGETLIDAQRTVGPTAVFELLGPPAPVLGGSSSPDEVPSQTTWTTTIDMRNAGYDATSGQRLEHGAALSARDSVAYVRVPREGDFSEAIENGAIGVTFTSAASGDGRPIYVSTLEVPALPTNATIAGSVDWRLCAPAGAGCDEAHLAALTLTKAQVRWVAFAIDELQVTDAAPRGTAPLGGATRVENPYLSYVTMTDVSSDAGTLVRPIAYFVSADTLQLANVPGIYDVHITAGCSVCDDGDQCTSDVCDPETRTCVYTHVTCGDDAGIYAPVADRAGNVVGAIHCRVVAGRLDCDTGPDTDGDGRPNLIVYANRRNACGNGD